MKPLELGPRYLGGYQDAIYTNLNQNIKPAVFDEDILLCKILIKEENFSLT
jgi:hypothetical protein